MSLYIKDWDKVFHLREAEKHEQVTWTKFPVSRAGLGYRRLMLTSAGHTAFSVFVGCVRLVARAKTNGKLVDNKGRDLTAEDLAAETGIKPKLCDAAMKMLRAAEIGWLTDKPPFSDRPQNGEEPANERLENGSRPEQSRADKKKTKDKGSESVGCPESQGSNSQGELPASPASPNHRTLRAMLEHLRVGEPALTRLAESEHISGAIVTREWESAQQGNPRDPRRVMVHALCRIAGVTLPRKRGSLGNSLASDPAVQKLLAIQASRRGVAS